jgi:methylenetetrahydrofolate dehydrogenase (NADP+)/methenyltetrahydrofolate cyclohydrolase
LLKWSTMDSKLIKGNEIAKRVRDELTREVQSLQEKGIKPGLAAVLVGDNPSSKIYVTNKNKACQEVGIFAETFRLSADTTQANLLELIQKLNHDPRFSGILVQLPLPAQIHEPTMLEAVFPEKDVDCFHPVNVGKLVIGKPYVVPCTPAGILELLQSYHISTQGEHVVVMGRSNIVGKPVANLLMQKASWADATVTMVHSRTRNIADFVRQADILIAAMGQPQFVTAEMVKEQVVVIDVGMNRIPAHNEKGYRLVGDVDFESVLPKASMITPVPGGVGPMTIAMLLRNTLTAAKYQGGIQS